MATLSIAPTAPLMAPVQTTNSQPATKTNATGTPSTQTGAPLPLPPRPGAPSLPGSPSLPGLPQTAPQPVGGSLPPVLPAAPSNPSLTPQAPTPVSQPASGGLSANPNPTPVPQPGPAPAPTTPPAPSAGSAGPITPTPLPNIPTAPATLNTGMFTGSAYSGPTPYSGVQPLSNYLNDGPNINRVAIAKDLLAQFDPLTEGKFRDDLRSATGQAAGMGQLGSGMWRSSLANVAADRGRERDAYGRQVMNAALTGSIDDFYRNVGIAQQQQGFSSQQQQTAFAQSFAQRQQQLAEQVASGQMSQQQAALELQRINSDRQYALQGAAQELQTKIANGQLTHQQAVLELQRQAQMFGQAVTQEQLYAMLQNQAFNQSATLLGLGSQGSPADYAGWMASNYGSQANAAGQSAGQLAYQAANRSGSGGSSGFPIGIPSTPPYIPPIGGVRTDTQQSRPT